MVSSMRRGREALCLLLSLLLLSTWEVGSGQLHYSVLEEAKHGTFVGRIAQDLGLELAEPVPRLFRRGGRSAECSIHPEVIVDRPLQVFYVDVEVKDINDNPPIFPMAVKTIRFHESRLLDSRFPLEGASDADIGVNALLSYKLSSSEFFFLDVQTNDELSQSLSLVLGKSLDREETAEVNLLLVATDGGKPELTGTLQILIQVLDVNDNEPSFAQPVYRVKLLENAPNGTLVVKLNASDADEGSNSEIVYSLSSDVYSTTQTKFKIDPSSGEIRTNAKLDYEENKSYEIQVVASDKGTPSMSGHCKISVKLVDINDNTPEIAITSLSLPIQEDAPLGTVIALITVSDRDSGTNGQVTCSLMPHVPFKLVSTFKNYYSLVLDSALDRESISDYTVVVTARDGGSPSLWATASVSAEAPKASSRAMVGAAGPESTLVDVNVYLIIAICAVSSLLVLTLLLYTALRCSAPPPEGACGPGKPTLVCSSAVGSWSYSQQRRSQRVCSGEGPPKTDLMAFSPSLPQGPGSAEERQQLSDSEHIAKVLRDLMSLSEVTEILEYFIVD
ncbi:Protocadherin alpha-2 [Tupaia chinensis]|uniref:Protocadherin alpha-2 n=1 Tax=Tupaia chinensis TaxID=246437 RepID=L9JV70_TUPCH|nr:Protocadherin alpha-2 [Tupaia chinensis]